MVVLDSNIFIYLSAGVLNSDILIDKEISFASVTRVEVLGYWQITSLEERKLSAIMDVYYEHDLSESILRKAIELRQERRMSLGDSIIAATALDCEGVLWTVNESDFSHIKNLKVFNPINKIGERKFSDNGSS